MPKYSCQMCGEQMPPHYIHKIICPRCSAEEKERKANADFRRSMLRSAGRNSPPVRSREPVVWPNEVLATYFGCVIGGPLALLILWLIAVALFSMPSAEKEKIRCPPAGCHTR